MMSRLLLCCILLIVRLGRALQNPSTVVKVSSFAVPRAPSGLYFDDGGSNLLYILSGSPRNATGDHHLYVFTTEGQQQCLITIPRAAGVTGVDGFYISHNDTQAYIVDSQGPIWAGETRLGASVYQVDWTDPCGCDSGTCSHSEVTWTPFGNRQWSFVTATNANEKSSNDDGHFHGSGIVVMDKSFFGVQSVHSGDDAATPSHTSKSLVKMDMATSSRVARWPLDGSNKDILGRDDVDPSRLTCGPDRCVTSLVIADRNNHIYEMDLSSGKATKEWDLKEIALGPNDDGIITALAYARTTGYYYVGIQSTSMIHVVDLRDTVAGEADQDREGKGPVLGVDTT
ncbi:expressed unknown protein [Seminavis robusta]|uniref:Uncharacterized protein n=1 Tax=Seminavis robusta TaxID=568900 RepID=A0A9N8H494_9STRA|nr:expressed unknown protein [Seminavis robusta]|eukprot:Sro108_g054130.1 n/a (342) ;mRNA; f:37580-38605